MGPKKLYHFRRRKDFLLKDKNSLAAVEEDDL